MYLSTHEQLQEISSRHEGLVASIYLPTEPRGPATRQSPIRFKNLVKEAIDRLEEHDAESVAAKVREACQPLLADHDFWRHQTEGLAVLCDDDRCVFYHLPQAPTEGVHVGKRFHIKPLLEAARSNRRFYVLALSLNECRLFEGDIEGLKEIDVPDLPRSLDDALRFDDPERSLQYHSGGREGRGQPIYHGQGAPADLSNDRTLRYFQACAKALDSYLAQRDKRPLLLAAVDEHLPIFRRAISYRGLVTEWHISGNPDVAGPSDLHKKAQEIIADLLDKDRDHALEEVDRLKGTGRSCTEIEQVATAMIQGRIQHLFVAGDKTLPGRIDLDSGEVELCDGSDGEATVDLLNEAAAEVLLHGGDAYVMPAETIPSATRAAAILRY